ncbi:MAG: pilus assembly protein PilE [Piscirickettsiaceae bacterium]|nr:MAG: pilus assembly protein PilE [Piscirickettsiaceae bacterium]
MKKHQKGFSLIELMIVVAIIGLLGMVAYPSYMESVRKSRISDGVAMINKIMQAQERFFVNNLTYTADLTDLGFANANNLPSEEGHYLVTAAACGNIAVCVNIITDAQGAQDTGTPADDNIGLNSQGAKSGKWPGDR